MAVVKRTPFGQWFPSGAIPAAFAQSDTPFQIEGKDGLRVLNDRPLNAETPLHLLDDDITPTSRLFVRNNGLVPEIAQKQDASGWQLQIDGEVEQPLTLSATKSKMARFGAYVDTNGLLRRKDDNPVMARIP